MHASGYIMVLMTAGDTPGQSVTVVAVARHVVHGPDLTALQLALAAHVVRRVEGAVLLLNARATLAVALGSAVHCTAGAAAKGGRGHEVLVLLLFVVLLHAELGLAP